MQRQRAILLLGPTGSGKSPLGDYIEKCGLQGCCCVHLDFGAQFRAANSQPASMPFLDASDLAVIRRVLETGELLSDSEFGVAAKILKHFLANSVGNDSWVILNGLPRNLFQAQAIESFVTVRLVVPLECLAEDAIARIASGQDGERKGRTDSELADIEARLRTYYEHTILLLQYYRVKYTRIIEFGVTVHTGPEEIWRVLNNASLG